MPALLIRISMPPRSATPDSEAAHLFPLLLPDRSDRDRFLKHTGSCGVSSVFHYLPLHDSPFGARFDGAECPVTTDVSARLARLPLFSDIGDDEIDRVVEAVTSFEAHG